MLRKGHGALYKAPRKGESDRLGRDGHGIKFIDLRFKGESLYWIKHFNFRLAVINVCPVLVPSELPLSTHLPTSEGWTAELTVGLW